MSWKVEWRAAVRLGSGRKWDRLCCSLPQRLRERVHNGAPWFCDSGNCHIMWPSWTERTFPIPCFLARVLVFSSTFSVGKLMIGYCVQLVLFHEACKNGMLILQSPVVTICTARFNIHKSYTLPTRRIYVIYVDLTINSDYFPIQH